MRAPTNLLIDLTALAVYVVATNPVATGTPVHEWLSLAVALVCFVHLVAHADWTAHVARRWLGRIGAVSRANAAVDVLLFAAMVAVVTSGLAVSRSALAVFGYAVSETSVWHAVHSQSSIFLLATLGVHLGMHWSWLVATVRRQIVERVRGPRTLPQRSAGASGARRTARPGGGARLARGVGAALIATAVTVGLVLVIAPVAQERMGWMSLPGSQAGERAADAQIWPAGVTVAVAGPRDADGGTAGFTGTPTERTAVRVSHSLVVLALSVLAGAALRGSVKSG